MTRNSLLAAGMATVVGVVAVVYAGPVTVAPALNNAAPVQTSASATPSVQTTVTPTPAAERLRLAITGPAEAHPGEVAIYTANYQAAAPANLAFMWSSRGLTFVSSELVSGQAEIKRTPASTSDVTVLWAVQQGEGELRLAIRVPEAAPGEQPGLLFQVSVYDADLGRPVSSVQTQEVSYSAASPTPATPVVPSVGNGQAAIRGGGPQVQIALGALGLAAALGLWYAGHRLQRRRAPR